ncbi:MAG: hypothetical protein LBI04_11155 [Treponema sp.]|nr:hypothetical protein [Treponema sp.]
MTDEEKKPRPNANYNLSRPDGTNSDGEEKLTFYYNRERRLEKSSQIVKDLYAEKKTGSRFNFLRPLVADKPRATVFFTIVLMSAAIILLSIVNKFGGSEVLEGNRIDIAGTRFEGTTIVVLTKTIRKNAKQAYSGAVDIAVSYPAAENEDYPVFYHRIFFSTDPIEEYRWAVPFDTPEQLIVLQTEKGKLQVKYKSE